MERIDEFRLRLDTPNGPVIIFANEAVAIDRASIDEIIAFSRVKATVEKLKEVGYLPEWAEIQGPIETPDFHKGADIPIGTCFAARGLVIPRAVGSDIGCGMRFMTTDVKRTEFDALGDRLDQIIRHIYFEGGRGISLSAQQRRNIFALGIPGLHLEHHDKEGIWKYWNDKQQKDDVLHLHQHGHFASSSAELMMNDFIIGSSQSGNTRYTFDDQTGSIGGGNHFVELQVVEETFDRHRSYDWGLRAGDIAIMVHSGSVGIGHQIGNRYTDLARSLYPEGLRHEHEFYMLAQQSQEMDDYLHMMRAAANFAFVNRLFLGLMMVRALSEALGRRIEAKVVWDAPHNFVWDEPDIEAGFYRFVHRKGATPAEEGDPVIIPGSMGSSSYILVGQGNRESFCSACHGAGRAKSRRKARRGDEDFSCRVITKIDPRMVRKDIRNDYMKTLMEEAPDQYKPITPVIETVEGAGIASRVARTTPLLTVKGI